MLSLSAPVCIVSNRASSVRCETDPLHRIVLIIRVKWLQLFPRRPRNRRMESEIGEHESVSTAVRRAVSAVKGRKPGALQPLTGVVDPDALDALFEPRSRDVPRTGGRLSFSYSSCRITIHHGEFLAIEPFETTRRLSAQSDGTDRAERSGSNRETQRTATQRTPESRICFVCQQPIEREDLQRERGELVHLRCHAELLCGISLLKRSEREV